jgi:hypothetical protein
LRNALQGTTVDLVGSPMQQHGSSGLSLYPLSATRILPVVQKGQVHYGLYLHIVSFNGNNNSMLGKRVQAHWQAGSLDKAMEWCIVRVASYGVVHCACFKRFGL